MTGGKRSRNKGCVEHAQAGRYGRTKRAGVNRPMHVCVWEDAHGPLPEGHHVHHVCENPRCILLEHLEAKPAREHLRDHKATVLDAETVARIRADYAALPLATDLRRPRHRVRPIRVRRGARAALAARYGITGDYLKQIIRGDRWAA